MSIKSVFKNVGKGLWGAFTLGVALVLVFSLWLIAWGDILSRKIEDYTSSPQPNARHNPTPKPKVHDTVWFGDMIGNTWVLIAVMAVFFWVFL